MDWIENILRESPVVQGGLTLMVAGWVGYQVRAIPARLFYLVRERCTRVIQIRQQSPLYDSWLRLLTEGAFRPGGPRTVEVRAPSCRYDEQAAASGLTAGADEFWARVSGKWCRVSIGRERAANGGADLVRQFIITVEVFLASNADLLGLLAEAKARANVTGDRQYVDIQTRYGTGRTITLPKRDPETLCLPRGLFRRLESRVLEFVDSRPDYERVGVPWRLGILLYGEPGTGKTSIAHTIASRTDRRLAVVPLADLKSDEDLFSAFEDIRDDSIVLLEDVDCAFEQRENEDAEGITFSGFLNCIDGVITPQNGRILMMSTNHIDRLDPALVRPGRVDLKLEVPLLTAEAATDYVDRLFAHVASRHDIVREVMERPGPTSAMLINRLMREDWRRTDGGPPEKTVPSGSAERVPASGGAQALRKGGWR